jgi:NADH-quinone oxidoreductase subunit I
LPESAWRKRQSFRESIYLWEILRGLGITMRHLLRNIFRTGEMPTVQYPEQHRAYSQRFRGRHRLMQRSDGSPRCVACMMCSTVCPADCIHIEAGEHPDPSIEKFPERFEIDLLRCVYCGLCEEACPCDAIRMDTGIYEIAADSRDRFIVNKEFLLTNDKDGTL